LAIANNLAMKMTTTIDSFGRLVLPKTIRSLLGIEQGIPLKIEVIGDKIQLSVAEAPRAEVKTKSGRPVFFGKLPEEWDSGEAVLRNRALRARNE
jgi:AbrB family looped-hinge helix DNA binding protein